MRHAIYIGLIIAAFMGAACLRFHSYGEAYYRAGWRDATAKLQREAVHSGHASFQTRDSKLVFVWNADTLPDYGPAQEARESGEAIMPVETNWFTRLMAW